MLSAISVRKNLRKRRGFFFGGEGEGVLAKVEGLDWLGGFGGTDFGRGGWPLFVGGAGGVEGELTGGTDLFEAELTGEGASGATGPGGGVAAEVAVLL